MAMNGGAAAVAGRRRHRRRPVMAEINVTPMVEWGESRPPATAAWRW
jgi:hypothetical protein